MLSVFEETVSVQALTFEADTVVVEEDRPTSILLTPNIVT